MKIMGFTQKIILGLVVVLGMTATVHANEAGPAWDKAPEPHPGGRAVGPG